MRSAVATCYKDKNINSSVAGGTGPADPATAGPIFLAYLITIQIEEVTSVYKDDIDASELSKQLEIFGSSFSINEQKWVGN